MLCGDQNKTSVVILTQGFAAPPQPAQLQPYTDRWQWRAKAWAGCPRVVLWLPWQRVRLSGGREPFPAR